MPRISIIVPARDAAATLGATLDALAVQDLGEPFEVVVADDASRDDTAALAEAHDVVTRVVRLRAPAGPGAARNAAVAAAGGALLAFTDADCVPAAGWLAAGTAALVAADLVQGAVVPDPAAPAGPFDRSVSVERLSGLFETASLFVRREAFEAAGGFEPWLRPRGKELGEDVWLGWRVQRAGGRAAFAPAAVVAHAVLPRGAGAHVAERARTRFFPMMASRIPELREAFLHRRLFLTRRSAAFDLALAGLMVAARGGRVPKAAAALAAVPYLRLVAGRARPWGLRRGAVVAAVDVAADAVTLAALAAGSVRARTLVL